MILFFSNTHSLDKPCFSTGVRFSGGHQFTCGNQILNHTRCFRQCQCFMQQSGFDVMPDTG